MVDVVPAVDLDPIVAARPESSRPSTPFGQAVLSLRDYLKSGQGSWLKVGEVSEPATSVSRRIRDRGAVSTEQAWRNHEAGETVYRHIITVGEQILHQTFQGFSRRGQ